MPENVQADAQFTMVRILRPFDDFEDTYQAQNPQIPVALFPTDLNGVIQAVDPQAADVGFDDQLLRFVPVPMGSRILVWIPYAISWDTDEQQINEQQYRYIFQWRVRDVAKMRAMVRGPGELEPYHLAPPIDGRPDRTAVAGTQPRWAIPCATRTVVVAQPEVAGNLAQVNRLRRERLDLYASHARSLCPLLPTGAVGYYQQGMLDPNEFAAAAPTLNQAAWRPLFMPFWFDAEGDELLITVVRDDAYTGGGVWNFNPTGPDVTFSSVYGRNAGGINQERNAALGVYLFTGSNP